MNNNNNNNVTDGVSTVYLDESLCVCVCVHPAGEMCELCASFAICSGGTLRSSGQTTNRSGRGAWLCVLLVVPEQRGGASPQRNTG